MSTTIGVIIPALNEGKNIARCLAPLLESSLPLEILVVDSGSRDNTADIAREKGVEVITLEKDEFNHGATREMARKMLDTEIVVMLSADAYPLDGTVVEKLVQPLLQKKAAASYGRQLPHDGSSILEAFPREFNYGPDSQLRSLEDTDRYGVYTFFCSNSFAAYVNSALDDIGGFKPVLTNEDYFAVAEFLRRGYKIAYVPEAQVKHSHSYSLKEEFQRYFDTGYVRGIRPWVQELVGHAESRGKDFFLTLIRRLVRTAPYLIPYAFLQTFMKWLGYRVGFHGHKLPQALKRALSAQKYYWDSSYYSQKAPMRSLPG